MNLLYNPRKQVIKLLTGAKKECVYALCVGLAEDNTIPTKPTSPRAQGLLTEVWQRRKREK